MTAETSEPTAQCASCGAGVADDANYCMNCGRPLGALPPVRRLAPARIVESTALEVSEPQTALVPQQARSGALAALPRLAALAWRQPAVRSVVTTGASAVAVSLVWRVAGAALTGRRVSRALLTNADGVSPVVGELLRGAMPSKRLRRRGRRGAIVEEMVYVRRILQK